MTNSIDLTSLAAVKNRAEVQSGGDDAEIQSAITGFSQHLLNYTGVASLNSIATLDETYDGNGNNRLFLRSRPIVNVSSVSISGASIPASGGPTVWGWYVRDDKLSISLRGGVGNYTTFPYPTPLSYRQRGPVFMLGTGNVEIVYAAGYPPTLIIDDIETVANSTVTLDSGPWVADDGVQYWPTLAPLTLVSNSPSKGEYAVSNGLYVFNPADNGSQVLVTYYVNQAPFDLEYAVRCAVALNYKRKGWQDQKSRAVTSQGASATTSYRDWAWPPELDKVFESYKRTAII